MSTNLRKRVNPVPPRLALLTSVETRHRYFVNALRRRFDVAAVVYAQPSYTPAKVDDAGLNPAERTLVAGHFGERSRQEEIFFGHDALRVESGEGSSVLQLEPGRLNSATTVEFLRDCGVNTLVVFGTDLIKPPLLAPEEWTMINMHLGLSPYYRGTATNFYPLLNEEPEYVGATIHRLDAGIDTGPILHHARPDIIAADQPHTIGCKAIAAGVSAMIGVLEGMERGENVTGVPQWKVANPRVYFRRDYHPRQVVELYQKWNQGLLARILAEHRPAPKLITFPVVRSAKPKSVYAEA